MLIGKSELKYFR